MADDGADGKNGWRKATAAAIVGDQRGIQFVVRCCS